MATSHYLGWVWSAPAFDALIRNLTWRFRAAEVRERERIEHELQVAQRIQQELLPEATPELDGWQIAAYYGPAREVARRLLRLPRARRRALRGWWLETPPVMVCLLLCDGNDPWHATGRCSEFGLAGRGTGAGQRRALPRYTLRDTVTCFYAILDPRSGHLVYANAGHDIPYHRRRNGDAEELGR